MGLGLLGRGVGDVEFLAGCGAHVLVTDMKNEVELSESVEKLKRFPNITFRLGGHTVDDFTECDLVIKAAGVPLNSPYIAAARIAGVPVAMSTALFAKYAMGAGAKIVGVTGTRGKSTITHMIYHTLVDAGKRALLGGNVRGASTLAMLSDVRAGDITVLELDSWQLQGFGDLGISPHVAVFSNLMPDHMNYYGGDMEKYFADKANIFRSQHQGDTLIVGNGIETRIREANPPVSPAYSEPIPADWKLQIPGVHNRGNAALAAGALRAVGLSEDEIRTGLESFPGVEGRLQLLGDIDGVKVYNDNNATTPEATIAALRALDTGEKNIILIAGGADKGLELDVLADEIKRTCARVTLLAHEKYAGTERLKAELREREVPFEEASDLKTALARGLSGQTDGVLLFSPAFASFGMFNNEYERNDEFVKLVRART